MSRYSSSLTQASPPPAAIEIGSQRVSAVSLEVRAGRAVITAYASEPLPHGALTPSLTGQNIHDPAAVSAAVGRALEQVGRPRRIVPSAASTTSQCSSIVVPMPIALP